jgi:hypothetical protein
VPIAMPRVSRELFLGLDLIIILPVNPLRLSSASDRTSFAMRYATEVGGKAEEGIAMKKR